MAKKKPKPVDLPAIIPTHVAIIMDGNGRWAKSRGLPRLAGHRAGVDNLRRVIEASMEFGIRYLTIYAFSTENWGRPEDEVRGLLNILDEVIDRELDELHRNGVQLRHIGRLERLDPRLQQKVRYAIDLTRDNDKFVLNVAWNYGGRDELVWAIQEIVRAGIPPDDINEETISRFLFTSDSPDPDLIIRTSGEMRVSNFLIWQGAYAELYITPVLWPDFDREQLSLALQDFAGRERRFGLVSNPPLKA
jgi:undecaprenyl diphosphate synthase